jgi:hypothetical protein
MSATRDDGRNGAPGATVAARIAHWRSKTWEELRDLMVPAVDAGRADPASFTAPPVRVTAVGDQGCR